MEMPVIFQLLIFGVSPTIKHRLQPIHHTSQVCYGCIHYMYSVS